MREKRKLTKTNPVWDFLVIIVFLSIAALSINLFRIDLLRTIHLRNVEPVGHVVIRRNIVQRRLSDRVIWDRLATESPVYLGDLIRVAELSAATLYIEGNSIALNENTLIRITRSPDQTLQIFLMEGNISLASGANSGRISVNINGYQIQPVRADEQMPAEWMPAVLNITAAENVIMLQVYEGTAMFIEDGLVREIQAGSQLTSSSPPENGFWQRQLSHVDTIPGEERFTIADGIEPQLQSPAFGSVFGFLDELPTLRFQWDRIDEASYYILEVCDTSDFFNPIISRESQITFFTVSSLPEGTWYWRVTPVLPPVYMGKPVLSQAAYFRVEQTAIEPVTIIEPAAIAAAQTVTELQPGIARAPVIRLPAPQNLQPARGHLFTTEYLRQAQSIIRFGWQDAQNANVYNLTIYQEIQGTRRQIYNTQIQNSTTYELKDLRMFDTGTFIWQVAAANGIPAESSFYMIIHLPGARADGMLLPAPQNLQPARGHRFTMSNLRTGNLEFSWQAVHGANAYILTIYQTIGGIQQIYRSAPLHDTSYIFKNLSILNGENFFWRVEAVGTREDNTIAQRGNPAEGTFILGITLPGTPILDLARVEVIGVNDED